MPTQLDPATLLAMSTDCACFNVRKAARALTAFYDQVMAPTGLRATQGTLLVALARAGDIPVTRLAGILGMDRTTLTRNLEPLERDRLVVIRPGEDRRVKLAGITEKGRKTLAAAIPFWREAQRQIAEGTGAGRWTELRRELGRITALADEAAGDAAEPDEGRTYHRRKS
ncbi:MAG TPA: MarR family winged helix-turn-helix transcriptional regulator [Gemmatimonadales bacterium]|nr:MarR family winged helix-turn-helix transcriptional regulator [Gemmatimonadales bacterium]